MTTERKTTPRPTAYCYITREDMVKLLTTGLDSFSGMNFNMPKDARFLRLYAHPDDQSIRLFWYSPSRGEGHPDRPTPETEQYT